MQKTLLIGYLGKDPEMKYTPSGTAIATAGTIISLGLCAFSGRHHPGAESGIHQPSASTSNGIVATWVRADVAKYSID